MKRTSRTIGISGETVRRQLSLSGETIRTLQSFELQRAAGGLPDQSIVYDCPTNASRCDRSCFSACTTVGGTTTNTTF